MNWQRIGQYEYEFDVNGYTGWYKAPGSIKKTFDASIKKRSVRLVPKSLVLMIDLNIIYPFWQILISSTILIDLAFT